MLPGNPGPSGVLPKEDLAGGAVLPATTGIGDTLTLIPTDQPWADYFCQLFPNHAAPASAWTEFKLASTGVNVTRQLWDIRARARHTYEQANGIDTSHWPIPHPPILLWMPEMSYGGCLRCTWLASRSGSATRCAGSVRKHAIDHGADFPVARAMEVPVWSRNAPHDPPPPVRSA